MTKKDLEAQNKAPKSLPKRVATTLLGGQNTVALEVEVSDVNGVGNHSFSFGGVHVSVPVPIGVATFHAVRGARSQRLLWTMWGEAGGTMKVTVTRAGDVIRQRDASQIVPPHLVGVDHFDIAVL